MTDKTVGVEIKEHPNLAGYGLSRDGRLWSRRSRNGIGPLKNEWRLIVQSVDDDGYLYFRVKDGRVSLHVRMSIAMLTTFCGPRPPGMQSCHNNGNRSDNRIENLRWDTKASNERDKNDHGTSPRGERNGDAKLTERQVVEIRSKYATGGTTHRMLAGEYGMSESAIGSIVNRRLWKHLP